jgi:hypothetical protein
MQRVRPERLEELEENEAMSLPSSKGDDIIVPVWLQKYDRGAPL